ncbi:MAG: thioredoxin family protein [Bacteroidales bacterium]
MKAKITLIALILIVSISCANSQSGKAISPKKETTGKGYVKSMNESQFLNQISDYKSNKDKWVYKGSRPCIIDFYADWCAPCRKVAPIMEELAKKYAGKVDFYKVDVEKEKGLARDLGIQSLPTLLYCPLKGEPQIIMGLQPEENYIRAINEIFNVQ